MKKILVIISLLFYSASYAQVDVGFNGALLLPATTYFEIPSPRSGFKLGAELIFSLGEHWKIRTGLDYYNFRFNDEFQRTDQHGNLLEKETVVYKSNHIGLPVGLRYVLKGDEVRPFLDFSVSYVKTIGHSVDLKSGGSYMYDPVPVSSFIYPTVGGGLMFKPSEKIYLTFLVNYAIQSTYMYNMYMGAQKVQVKYNSINGILSLGYNF